MAGMLVRIGMALVALVVAAALIVQLRAHDMLENTKDIVVQPHPSAAAVDAQLKDLEAVEDLRPGGQAALAAASLDLRARRARYAVRYATKATRRDPENFAAWVTLGVALDGSGRRAAAHAAYRRAHLLNPRYPLPR
jgi:tetratricopeptide (TPR) repeat protein